MSAAKINRKLHRWGAVLVAIPLVWVIGTGLLLQLKKEVSWIQPATVRGTSTTPSISFDRVLDAARGAPEAGIESWEDIDRIDVRPGRGMLKVRSKSSWEVQIDAESGAILQVAYRRSDLIEGIHDGSWIHDGAKLWLHLPVGAALLGLLGTGVYLWLLPHLVRRRRRHDAT